MIIIYNRAEFLTKITLLFWMKRCLKLFWFFTDPRVLYEEATGIAGSWTLLWSEL